MQVSSLIACGVQGVQQGGGKHPAHGERRLWVSAIAGFFFLLVFAIFRGKIQVYRTRLVSPHYHPPKLPLFYATVTPKVAQSAVSSKVHDAAGNRIFPVCGTSLRSSQWAASTTSGAPQSPCCALQALPLRSTPCMLIDCLLFPF